MLRWQSYQDLPDEEMRSRREDILTHQERKCSLEERRRQVEEEARRSSLEEQRRIHLRKEEERRISLEAEVGIIWFEWVQAIKGEGSKTRATKFDLSSEWVT